MKNSLVVALVVFAGMAFGHSNYTGYSGAPGRSTCARSCHGGSGGTITVSGFPSSYTPNQAYTVWIRHSSGSSISNFNCSIRIGTGSTNAGTITAGLNTSTYNVSGETNGVHFTSSNRDSGNFTWTAPASLTGTVRLYLGGLQGNKDGPNTTTVLVSDEAALHDVGGTRVLAPTGMIDSGQTVTPACSVYNYGNQTESYRVRLRVGGFYNDTARVTSHAPGTRAYIAFPAYSAWPRGTFSVSCSTELSGDAVPSNDKATGSVTVRVHDVAALAILAPTDTVDSGTTVVPACSVANYGTVAETYRVKMRIGSFYSDSAQVTAQPAGARTYVAFPAWTVTEAGGPHAVSCSTALAGDLVPDNNRLTGSVLVTLPFRDVAPIQIIAPVDTIDTGSVVTPAAVLHNYGEVRESFLVRLTIGSSYTSDTAVTVAAGADDTVRFRDWVVQQTGLHIVRCSTMLAADSNPANDLVTDSVFVEGLGLAAPGSAPLRFALGQSEPNPFRGSAQIRLDVPRQAAVSVSIYSPAGTLVRSIDHSALAPARYSLTWNGRDNAGRLVAPGIYYLRLVAPGFVAGRTLTLVR